MLRKIYLSAAFALLLGAGQALAADARFAWSPNSEQSLAGYKIYCGLQSRVYAAPVDQIMGTMVSGIVTGTVSGLEAGKTYYCAATAYDGDGFESLFSNEVSFVAKDRTMLAAPPLQAVIFKPNPDGTFDLLKADGSPLLDGSGNPIAGVSLPE